ncbi:MAG: hypothetical protein HN337_06160 [Deltaproteobacteria bacterium]|jgi:hypothetical protein|nr:hypothetical protein [Deltaproteobacteria bacterium]
MKSPNFKELERRVHILKKRCPWVAMMLLHCLKTRNPKAFKAMRLMLARLGPTAAI